MSASRSALRSWAARSLSGGSAAINRQQQQSPGRQQSPGPAALNPAFKAPSLDKAVDPVASHEPVYEAVDGSDGEAVAASTYETPDDSTAYQDADLLPMDVAAGTYASLLNRETN